MRKSIMVRVGAFGTIFRTSRRHQGRHRFVPVSGAGTHAALTGTTSGQQQTAAVDHLDTERSVQDFHVVFANVPALPNSLGS
jgi:hypothetical protein